MFKKLSLVLYALTATLSMSAFQIESVGSGDHDDFVLYENTEYWPSVSLHWWGDLYNDYPGIPMTYIGDNIWAYIGQSGNDAGEVTTYVGNNWCFTSDNFETPSWGPEGAGGQENWFNKVYNYNGRTDREIEMYVLRGSFGDGIWKSILLEKKADGTWQTKGYFGTGDFGIRHIKGNEQKNWYNADNSSQTQDQNGGDLGSNGNFSLRQPGEYYFVFDPAKNTVGFYLKEDPKDPDPEKPEDKEGDYYVLHGNIYSSSPDASWVDMYLQLEDDGTWSTTRYFYAGNFGVKKFDQGGNEKMWYNYTGYNDIGEIADNVSKAGVIDGINEVTLTSTVQNFYLDISEAGWYKFIFDPDKIQLGFVKTDLTDMYIRHSNMAGEWEQATPQKMTYDPKTKIYSYQLPAKGELAISRAFESVLFGKDEYMLRPSSALNPKVAAGYIHFAEPTYYYNMENGVYGAHNFTAYCGGTLKIKYDTEKGVGNIWIEPSKWPELHIMGAIIAPESATQPAEGNGAKTEGGQWMNYDNLIHDKDGRYYYDLGQRNCEIDNGMHFNLNDFFSEPNATGEIQNEIGHFNFSFINDINNAWMDFFAPEGKGMAQLSREGMPTNFVYHDFENMRENWVSTNFVFKERCRIWVDVVRQIVWVEMCEEDAELSDEQVMFTFWDKRGEKYPVEEYSYLRWWGTGNLTEQDYAVELVAFNGEEEIVEPLKKDAWSLSVHSSEGITDGVYHGISANLSENFVNEIYEAFGKDVNIKDKLWVRIYNKTNSTLEEGTAILRPYVEEAIYTQVIGDNPAFNEYNEITEEELKVTVTTDIRVINNATPAERMTGGLTADETVVYPSVNQYQNVLTFNDPIVFTDENDSALFKKTYSVTGFIGNKEFSAHDEEAKQNQIILTGINPEVFDIDNFDKFYISLEYNSPGMIFTRSYERQLTDIDHYLDNQDMPVMNHQNGTGTVEYETIAFLGAPEYIDENGETKTEGHCALDLVLHKSFQFRDEMIKNRAAYIRYQITGMRIKNKNEDYWKDYEGECMMEGKNLPESELHVATNGRPVTWEFGDEKVNKFGELWYQEAFVNKQLDIQLSHVLCAESPEALKKLNMEFQVDVEYELIVPFADEVAAYFETPETGTPMQVKRRAGEGGGEESEELTAAPVDKTVPGYDNEEGYKNTLSAPEGDEYIDKATFKFETSEELVTTGVENITVAETEEGEVEFYNLQGIRMNAERLSPGIYIRRTSNGLTSKIYIN